MKKEHLPFFAGGLAFGLLLGFGIFRSFATRPVPVTAGAQDIPSVAGPAAPTDVAGGQAPSSPGGGGGGAPMVAEINALRERVQKNPADTKAWSRLGNLYQDAGMYQPAIGFYQRVIAIDAKDAAVLTDMGICYQELGQLDRALELFTQAQAADPSNWQSVYNTVVVAGLGLGQFDKADAALARLESVKPDAPRLDELKASLAKARADRSKSR